MNPRNGKGNSERNSKLMPVHTEYNQLLTAVSDYALAIAELVEPFTTEQQLTSAELDEIILLKRRLDDVGDVVAQLSGIVKTEAEARVKALTNQCYEVPSFNPGKVWRAKMKTRKGNVTLDIQGTKSSLVEQGIPINIINTTFDANTKKGKDSHYLEIREVKAGQLDSE